MTMHQHPHRGHPGGHRGGRWERDYGPGGNIMEMMARKFGGGRHGFGPFGKGFGGSGGFFRAGRMLADGDLRLIALALLAEGPRHGYDIIKALEELSSGIYSPSPGVVYPTLTFLEEAGYASSATEGNKRVFSITDAGRAYLDENRAIVDGVLEQIERFGRKMAAAREWFDWSDDEPGQRRDDWHGRHGLRREFHEVRRRIRMALAELMHAPAERQQQAIAILNRAADDLGKLARGNDDDAEDL
jgi:DNA-binding PadR family transcriptional regulator